MTAHSIAHLDSRRIPARPELAAAHLEGVVSAERYVEGIRMEVMAAVLPLKKSPGFDKSLETEAVRGEYFTVYESGEEGWAWGQLQRDGYVGWLPSDALAAPAGPHTHRVAAVRTFAYPGPSMKLPVQSVLSIGSRLAIDEIRDGFARTSDGFVPLCRPSEADRSRRA